MIEVCELRQQSYREWGLGREGVPDGNLGQPDDGKHAFSMVGALEAEVVGMAEPGKHRCERPDLDHDSDSR